MARVEDVVLGLLALAETGDAVVLPDRAEGVAPAGDQFVRVCLMAGVPDELVERRIEHVVKCERELDDAEVPSEVASELGDNFDDLLADLLRDLRKVFLI